MTLDQFSFQKEDKIIYGGCLCGSVRFKINGKLRNIINCHCRQCLRTHGHFSAYTAVGKKNLEFLKDDGLRWFHSSKKARRGFCKECGASIFYERFSVDRLSISAGMLDSTEGIQSTEHIFFDERQSYYEIKDNLPKYSQYYFEKL